MFVALLAADAARLTADDIAAVLQVSPAAVSGAVRYLLPVGLATRVVPSPGSRRYWYRTPLRLRPERAAYEVAEPRLGGINCVGVGHPLTHARRPEQTSLPVDRWMFFASPPNARIHQMHDCLRHWS